MKGESNRGSGMLMALAAGRRPRGIGDADAGKRTEEQGGDRDDTNDRVLVKDVAERCLVSVVDPRVDHDVDGDNGADDPPAMPPTMMSMIQPRVLGSTTSASRRIGIRLNQRCESVSFRQRELEHALAVFVAVGEVAAHQASQPT